MTTKGENEKLSEAEELAKLNKLFAKRYTHEDEEYIQMAKPRSQTPPIVDDWGQNNNNNYQNRRRHDSNDRFNNRYAYQQYGNHSHHTRSRSPPYYHDKRR